MYFGEIGKRYDLTLTLTKQYTYETCFGYRAQDNYINTFADANGNVYVWKTTKFMGMDKTNKRGDWQFDEVRVNDTVTVKATVKDHSDYKGVQQTILTRVSVTSINHAPTKQELDEIKRDEQIASLADNDLVWTMPYKQFKEHYSDCETLAGSFNRYEDDRGVPTRTSTIDVIIRAGRLVPSGVRGQHFSGYEFLIDGKRCCFRAVSEENAERRCRKEFPRAQNIECVKIYR